MRVLIADDDPVSRRLLEVALVQMGHTVVVVSEGLAAIEALIAIDGPRIAIIDWMMPGADGLAVCRAVRQRAAPYVYVILLTARHSQADIVAAQDAEADEFLTKPFDTLELRGRLLAGERILNLQEKLVQAHDAMQHQASHDHLTGLWNRRMILQQLDREVQRSARDRSELAVILADFYYPEYRSLLNTMSGPASCGQRERNRSIHLAHSSSSSKLVSRSWLTSTTVTAGCSSASHPARSDPGTSSPSRVLT